MTKALILDFGGVVTRTLFETHDLTEAALGIVPGTLKWRGPFDPDSDPEWRSMQRGEISERDYWRLRTKEVGKLVGENWQEMHQLLWLRSLYYPRPTNFPLGMTLCLSVSFLT